MFKKILTLALPLLFATVVLNVTLRVVSSNQPMTLRTLPPPPATLRSTFMLGIGNQPQHIGWMTGSGIPWDVRYQYLVGGANTNAGWSTWNSPSGAFVNAYLADSDRGNYLSVFTYYMLLQSQPQTGTNESERDYNNLNNPATMNSYYADFKLLMDRLSLYNKPVIVQIEPDLWGILEKRNANPNAVGAAVSGSGYGEVAAYPDNVAGFARALTHLRDKYAPKVLLGYHISPWASTQGDVGLNHNAMDVQTAAQETSNFYLQTGANFDLMFYDIADRDAAFYDASGQPGHWWDTTNASYPNFNRFNQFALAVTTLTGKRGMLWQVPIGNNLLRSMNNTNHHWQDNRVQYYLGDTTSQHVRDLANAGIIGILFGAGDGNTTTNYDDASDGVTNPAPINGNTQTAQYSDDDGGYLRLQAQAYYARGAVSLRPATPTNLTATSPSASQITLSWADSVGDATGFSVEMKIGSTGGWGQVATVVGNTTSYSVTGLQNGTLYSFRLRAYNTVGYSDYSNEAAATTSLPAPSALSLTAPRSTQVSLGWADNSNSEQNFLVERSPNGNDSWTAGGSVGLNITTYLDDGRSPDTTYYYRVRAATAYTYSDYSNSASIITPPAEPSALQATSATATSLTLGWTNNSTTATGFRLDRKIGPAGSWQPVYATLPASPTTFTDNSLSTGTVYYYRLRAYVSSRESANSNEASAITTGALVVQSNTDDGTGNTANSLSKALLQAKTGPSKTITFATGLTSINLTGMLPDVPDGVTIGGGCGTNGPTVSLTGLKQTLQLGPNTILYGLRLGGFQAPHLTGATAPNYVFCVSTSR